MGTGSFSRVKRSVHGVYHPPASSDEVKAKVQLYLYSPCGRSWPVIGRSLLFLYLLLIFFLAFQSYKGKAVPLQAWSGPEGSRKLRLPDFMTTQDGGKVVSLTYRPPLPPVNTPGTHLC